MSSFFKATVGEMHDFHRVLFVQVKLTREEVMTARTYPEFTAWFAGHIRNLMKDIVLYQGPCDRWQVDNGHLYVSFVRMSKGSAARIVLRDGNDAFFLAPADEDWRIDHGVLYVGKWTADELNILAQRQNDKSETVWSGPNVSWDVADGHVYYRDSKGLLYRIGEHSLLFDEPVEDWGTDGEGVIANFNDGRKKYLVSSKGRVLYEYDAHFDWTIGPDGIYVLWHHGVGST